MFNLNAALFSSIMASHIFHQFKVEEVKDTKLVDFMRIIYTQLSKHRMCKD